MKYYFVVDYKLSQDKNSNKWNNFLKSNPVGVEIKDYDAYCGKICKKLFTKSKKLPKDAFALRCTLFEVNNGETTERWSNVYEKSNFDLKDVNTEKAKVKLYVSKDEIRVEYLQDSKQVIFATNPDNNQTINRQMVWYFNSNELYKFIETDGGVLVHFHYDDNGDIFYTLGDMINTSQTRISFLKKEDKITPKDIKEFLYTIQDEKDIVDFAWFKGELKIEDSYKKENKVIKLKDITKVYEEIIKYLNYSERKRIIYSMEYIPVEEVLDKINKRPTYDEVLNHVRDEYDVVEEVKVDKNFSIFDIDDEDTLTYYF